MSATILPAILHIFAGDPTAGAGVPSAIDQVLVDSTSNKLYWKSGAGDTAWSQIVAAGSVVGFTQGSVLFVGPAGTPAQDNAKLFWNDAADRLGIGNAAPSTTLDVTGIATAQSINVTNVGSAFYASADGSTAAVSAANTGRLRYNDTAKKWQISIDTGAYADLVSGTGAGMAIGNTVTSGTTGSLLYVAAGPVLAQNNANLFWDNGNTRLGIGNAAPSTTLDVTGIATARSMNVSNAGSAFYASADGASAAVSAANTGRLRYNDTAKKWQISIDTGAYADLVSGTGAGMAIGNTVTSGTTGSVLFVGAGPVLAQDNATFFWDTANKRLGLGTATTTTTTQRLQVVSAAVADAESIKVLAGGTNTYADLVWFNSSGVQFGGIGYAGSAVTSTAMRDLNFFYSPGGGKDWIFTDATTVWMKWSLTTNSFGLQWANGSSATTSEVNTGKITYTTTGQKFQASLNQGAVQDFMLIQNAPASAGTGAIPFITTRPTFNLDDTKLFWGNGDRLGLGTNNPQYPIHLKLAKNADVAAVLCNNQAGDTGYSGIGFAISTDLNNVKASIGYGNASVGLTHFRTNNFLYSGGPDWVMGNATKNEFLFSMTDGSTAIQFADGVSAGVSASGTGKLRYNNTSKTFQVSLDGAAFVSLVTL